MNFIAVFKNGQKVLIENCTSYKISTDQSAPMGYVGVVAALDHTTSRRVFINPAEALYWGAEEHFQDVTPEPEKEEPQRTDCATCVYKHKFEHLMNLPNCNDCLNAASGSCGIRPQFGGDVRINCYRWDPKEEAEQ